MKKIGLLLFFILIVALRVTGQVSYSPNTYYLIPPKNGCDGMWAFSIPMGCRSTYSSSPCHGYSIDHYNGDTVFLKLCSIPCSFTSVSPDGSNICYATCEYITTGIEKMFKSKFSLYPNPNDGNMVLEYELKNNEKAEMEITDIVGKVICKYNLSNENKSINVSCDELRNGVYLYRILENNVIIHIDKLVIMK